MGASSNRLMATVAVHGVTDSIKHKTSKSLSVTLATPVSSKYSILTPDTEQSGSCHNWRGAAGVTVGRLSEVSYRGLPTGDAMGDYDTDFAAWSDHQAELLRRMGAGERVNNQVDWENVAEEIETLGHSDKREIRNRLAVICEHLLKWVHQPEQRSSSWRGSVVEARQQIASLIEESPSLKGYPATALVGRHGAYVHGRAKVMIVAELVGLPEICPWSIEQLLDDDYWPAAEGSIGGLPSF